MNFEFMRTIPRLPQATGNWLHEARKRHDEIERELGDTEPTSLELDGSKFIHSALTMLEVALPPDGEPHPKARLCAEDAMFAMLMAGIAIGRLNEMRGGEARGN